MLKFNNISKALLTFSFIISFCLTYSSAQIALDTLNISIKQKIKNTARSIQSNPSDSFNKLNDILVICKQQDDTTNILESLISLGDVERFRGNYEASFDYLWEALLYVKSDKPNKHSITINRNLGILYQIYNKEDKAMQHLLLALSESKAIKVKGLNSQLIYTYFSLATFYKDKAQYNAALAYLDSCTLIHDKNKEQPFVDANKGYIYLQMGDLPNAKNHLYKSLHNISKQDHRYQIVILSYLGDLKLEMAEPDSALHYYNASLSDLNKQNAYIEIKPDLYRKVSDIYKNKGNMNKAYYNLLASKHASDSLFSLTNTRNNELFEVKNKYKETIDARERVIK